MDRQYFRGFLLGLLVAFLFSTVLLWILLVYTRNNQQNTVDNSNKGVSQKINTIIDYIDAYYMGEYDKNDLYEKAYAGIVSGLEDVYSTYFTREEYKVFEEQTSGTFVGIGSYVSIDDETKYPCLTKPIKDGPADKAGIKPGDLLIKVDGEDVNGQDLDLVVSKIKGEKDTKVKLTIFRDGVPNYLEFTITRAEVAAISVENQILDGNIGYVQVTSFAEKTAIQFDKALDEMCEQGIKGLIIDLRSNPGGYLNVAIDMCDRILPADKLVTYTKDKKDYKVEYKTKDAEECNLPIVVIVNNNSASASEVFTGCLKDYDKVTVIGETTFGKGIVQTVFPLADGSKLKLTSSYYYSPKGTNIHGTGIEPDIKVEDDENTEQDELIEKAKELLGK